MSKIFVRPFFLQILLFLLLKTSYAHVELTYPEGGEIFKPGDTINITWVEAQSHVTQNWELYYSPDAGESWFTISQNIAVPLREFEWILPLEMTKKGRIKVIQNNVETDYQDVSANFTIENATGIFENSISLNSFYNYPNPFRESTTFSFKLEKRFHVSLKIYNLAGSLVERIIDEEMNAGPHTISWDTNSNNAGIYFYTIQIGNAIRVKKLQVAH